MSTDKYSDEELKLEVTVLSAHSLKNPSFSLLPGRRLRPFVSLSTSLENQNNNSHSTNLYQSSIDETGGHNPSWKDIITIRINGPAFIRAATTSKNLDNRNYEDESGAVRVRVQSKRLFRGPAELGWCKIQAADVLDGLRPPSKRRRLSYSLCSPSHGCRGYGIIDLAVRVVGNDVDRRLGAVGLDTRMPEPGWCRIAVGIPAGALAEGEAVWGTPLRG